MDDFLGKEHSKDFSNCQSNNNAHNLIEWHHCMASVKILSGSEQIYRSDARDPTFDWNLPQERDCPDNLRRSIISTDYSFRAIRQ